MEDSLILIISLVSFIVFLVLFLCNIKSINDQDVFKHIKKTFLYAMLLNLIVGLLTVSILIIVLSLLLFALMSFVFVLCVFGPYETSIRIKLIDIIGEGSGIKSKPGVYSSYNGVHLLDVRLKRLTGNGDVILEGNKYKAVNQGNAFFIIEQMASLLRRLYRIDI